MRRDATGGLPDGGGRGGRSPTAFPRPNPAGGWGASVRRELARVFDLLYPRLCPVCGAPSDRPGRLICWTCFARLPLHVIADGHCRRCGKIPAGAVSQDFLCDACRRVPPHFDQARTAATFRGSLRVLLHQFKYNGATWLAADLVDLLDGALQTYYDPSRIDLVLAVPLHVSRLRKRSYNQAALLARALARRRQLECRTGVIRRNWATPTQTRLGVRERLRNVHGAFGVVQSEWVRGRTVLMIDDVMTTGATLSEAARCLKAAGAWRVWALAVARD